MKTNKIIIWCIVSVVLTSCFTQHYRFITHVERNGSCRAEVHEIADSLSSISFSRWHSSGWEISQTDTLSKNFMLEKNRKYIIISKKFQSVEKMSADTTRQLYLTPRESLKKRFRWFYTYYEFTAVYPEVTEKGRVPLGQYLNKDEQKFYLQGDMSAFRGVNGWDLAGLVEDIHDHFMRWYSRTVYEESIDIMMQFTDPDLRVQVLDVKDSLYSVHEKQIENFVPMMNEICNWLDKHFVTNYFSELYRGNENKIDKMLEEKTKETDERQKLVIQYDLTLPGKLISTNSDQQNDGTLVWHVNMLKFLADN